MVAPDLIAFMSYAHVSDDTERAKLESLRSRLMSEVEIQSGSRFHIFYDHKDIQWGEAWQRRIDSEVDDSSYLIPIITPRYFTSDHCKREFRRFADREQLFRRHDLILPIYYVKAPQIESDSTDDEIAKTLKTRQIADFRELRIQGFGSDFFHSEVARIASRIVESEHEALARAASRKRTFHMSGIALPKLASTRPEVADPSDIVPLEILLTPEAIGIAAIFPNWDSCQDELLRAVTDARYIRVFVQIGKSVLSGAAVIYRALERTRSSAEIRILHSAPDSPYLGERIAIGRDSNFTEWREDMDYAKKVADRLKEKFGSRLTLREHSEGYVWRLFILDDTAYVQPYLYQRDNAARAPVVKVRLNSATTGGSANPNSLYHMFSNYFDFKWDECAEAPAALTDLIGPDTKASVVGFINYGGYLLFVVPKRYVEGEGAEVAFHGIGGKRDAGEDFANALRREALEEVGVEIDVRSSAFTRHMTATAEFGRTQLADDPRPYCIFERRNSTESRKGLPGSRGDFRNPDVNWMVGYLANVADEDEPRPLREVAALLLLSPATLARTARESISYADIEEIGDGSRIIVQDGVRFDFSKRAVPTGLATVQVLRWR